MQVVASWTHADSRRVKRELPALPACYWVMSVLRAQAGDLAMPAALQTPCRHLASADAQGMRQACPILACSKEGGRFGAKQAGNCTPAPASPQ